MRLAREDQLLAAHLLADEILQPGYTKVPEAMWTCVGMLQFPLTHDQPDQPPDQDQGDEPIDRPSLQFSPSAAGPETSSSSRPSGLAQIPEDDGMDFQPSDLRTGYDDMQEPEPAPIPSSTPQVSRMPGKAAPVPTAQHQPVQVDDDALNFEPCHAHQPAQSADGSLEPCHVDSRPT